MQVTIEGSIQPCEDLPTGHVRTVELTDSVRRRIEAGFYLLRGPKTTLAELDEDAAAQFEVFAADDRDPDEDPLPSNVPPADEPADDGEKPEQPPAVKASRRSGVKASGGR